MVTRRLLPELRRRLARYPAALLLGPRQCGKTTLARALGGAYFDLEQEPERLRLDLEWGDRLAARERIILDEAQSWPEVFSRLRGAIDRDRRRNDRFLLLGSVAPSLVARAFRLVAGPLEAVRRGLVAVVEAGGELGIVGAIPQAARASAVLHAVAAAERDRVAEGKS